MINLSEKAVADFIKIYEHEFGVRLEESIARSIASEFLQFFALIYYGETNENKIQVKD